MWQWDLEGKSAPLPPIQTRTAGPVEEGEERGIYGATVIARARELGCCLASSGNHGGGGSGGAVSDHPFSDICVMILISFITVLFCVTVAIHSHEL